MQLETERLLLRPLGVADAAVLGRLFMGDWEAIKQTGRMPYPPREAALRDWIAAQEAPASHTFLVLRRHDCEPLGGIGFGGEGDLAELGYALGRLHWGQGYATEAVRAMIAHARQVGFARLEAFSFVENPASARVLEKAGFTYLGVVRRRYSQRGGLRRVRHYQKRLGGDNQDAISKAWPQRP
jgi:ribosomal-protein-alanine N-acetyltransferase